MQATRQYENKADDEDVEKPNDKANSQDKPYGR